MERCAGQRLNPCPASLRRSCVLRLALPLVSCTSLKYFDFVWISGSKSQLKINRSTSKQLKKKKGNSNHSVNKNDSASQLTVLSGPVTFVGGGFHSIWHLVKCLHSCGKPGAVISGTLVDLLSGRVKMALPLSLSSLPKLHVVTFEDFARV